MPILSNIWRQVYVTIATARWLLLFAIYLTHMLSSMFMLYLVGEEEITTNLATWFYYYTVTATTVGYGDLSPSSDLGRTITSIYVLPGAIGLFTVVLGKAISQIGNYWKGRLMGKGNYERRQGHLIIMGWQGERTKRLLESVLHEQSPEQQCPILVCAEVTENPMPENIDFISIETLSDVKGLQRAGAAGAKAIIVRGRNDDETLAATLAALSQGQDARIIAYFDEESAASLVNGRADNLEVTVSVSNDILVRAAYDPGTSALSRLLFSGANPDTAYTMEVPEGNEAMEFIRMMLGLKLVHSVTLIGAKSPNQNEPDLNCASTRTIVPGDKIYYIADHRLKAGEIDWGKVKQEGEVT